MSALRKKIIGEKMENRKIFCLVICAVAILTIGSIVYLGAEEEGVNVVCHAVSTQGKAENNSGMESVKVHGMVWNTGDKIAENVTITVIFTDSAHDKVIKKTVEEGIDLLPNGKLRIKFDAEYLRELTIPKTLVDEAIQIDWEEDGQLKTMRIPSEEFENGE